MKTLTITFALLLSSFLFYAQETQTYDITVTIDNVKNDNGKVLVSLHDKSTFMTPKNIQTSETKIENGKIKVTFEDVVPGTYAIMAMHDENDNKAMDFDTNGMPLENYGMSNNPMSFGPPQYSDAKFDLKNEDLEMNIRF
ncbi:DUF2141 domain-containing protein [Lacinutrix chionoecetis]